MFPMVPKEVLVYSPYKTFRIRLRPFHERPHDGGGLFCVSVQPGQIVTWQFRKFLKVMNVSRGWRPEGLPTGTEKTAEWNEFYFPTRAHPRCLLFPLCVGLAPARACRVCCYRPPPSSPLDL